MEHITCDCAVLGTWQSGLIALHDGRPHAVGKPQAHHNLYPTSTKLLDGDRLRVVSQKVDIRGRTLRWLFERLDKRRIYYPVGRDDGGEQAGEDRGRRSLPARRLRWEGAQAALCPGGGTRPLPWHGGAGEVYAQVWLREGRDWWRCRSVMRGQKR